MFKYKAEICGNYAGHEFYDKQYPVMIICPNTVKFKDKKLYLIEDVLHRTVPHPILINKPKFRSRIIKRKRHVIYFQNPRMTKFDDDNKMAAHAATKSIYKIDMPNVQFLKNAMPIKLKRYEVTVILDGYDDFIKDNLKDFNDIFEFCLKSTPPVQLLIIKESLIDYPLDMKDITDTKKNPILHSSEVFIMGFHHLPKCEKQKQNLLNIRHMLSGFTCAHLLDLVNSDPKDEQAFLHISRGKLCLQHNEGYWHNVLLESQWLKYPIINCHFRPTTYLHVKTYGSKLALWPHDDWYINDYNWARVTLNRVQNYRQVKRRSRSLFSYNPYVNECMNKILSTNKGICLLMNMIPGLDYLKL